MKHEVVGDDTYNGELTRIFIWYPTENPDWQHDRSIKRYIDQLNCGGKYKISGGVYYWNPYDYGCVIAIARRIP